MKKKLAIFAAMAAAIAILTVFVPVRDELAWFRASRQDGAADYAGYIRSWPGGRHLDAAQQRLDDREWAAARGSNTNAALATYLRAHPGGSHAQRARNGLDTLDWVAALQSGTGAAFRRYLQAYPQGAFAADAAAAERAAREDDLPYLRAVERPLSREWLSRFLADYPGHVREAEVRAALRDLEGRGIVELMEEEKIVVRARGSGIEAVTVEIRSTAEYQLTVRIPAGTFFVSNNPGAQNMVSTEDVEVDVEIDESVEVEVSAACANQPKDVPGADDTFTIRASPRQAELRQLMAVLAPAGVGYSVRQAAIWIVTDDADYEGLGALVGGGGYGPRLINEHEAAQAMRLCDRAGIEIERKAIWRDREAIAAGVGDEALRAWLLQPAGS